MSSGGASIKYQGLFHSNERGGGVVLFIDTEIKCKINDQMSTVVENVMKIITAETLNKI